MNTDENEKERGVKSPFTGRLIMIGNPATEKRLRDWIAVYKGASMGASESIDSKHSNPYVMYSHGIPDWIHTGAEFQNKILGIPFGVTQPNIEKAEKLREEATRNRWKVGGWCVGFEITSEDEYFKAMAGAPEGIVKNPVITPAAWELCRQFQKMPASDLNGLAMAMGVHPYTLQNIKTMADHLKRVSDPNPCECEAADLQPFGECVCESGRRARLEKLGLCNTFEPHRYGNH
jgi:hypothetical protein